jgi:hypothetical protein
MPMDLRVHSAVGIPSRPHPDDLIWRVAVHARVVAVALYQAGSNAGVERLGRGIKSLLQQRCLIKGVCLCDLILCPNVLRFAELHAKAQTDKQTASDATHAQLPVCSWSVPLLIR